MRIFTVFTCLVAAAVAAPAQIIFDAHDHASKSALRISRVQETVQEDWHTVVDPSDGSVIVWACGERSVFGTEMLCKQTTAVAGEYSHSWTYELFCANVVLFLAMWAFLYFLIELALDVFFPEQPDAEQQVPEATVVFLDEKTDGPM